MTGRTVTNGSTTLMNLTFNYSAQAGQMGAGATAGNTGQLVGITGAINGQTESASYNFDLIGRLVTSSQTSDGVTAARRFAYDRWGNRTGEWDAVSGGNQIQSVTLQQSGGAPTNQIQSVTTGGTPASYSYDNAGNVINDGAHTYTYDGADRLVSVDGGVTSQSAYDYKNRRVKKVLGSATTHYVWNGSLVLAEHNGSTGASITDYVYAHQALVATISGSVVQYSVRDRLSERMSLDSSGNVLGVQSHLPFGEDFAESGTQEKHHFTTYERDIESGGDYAMNREYSPGTGRFGGVDAGAARPKDPQTFNRYAYTRNNPIEYVDSQGLDCQPWLHVEYWQGDDGGIVVDWSNTYVYEVCSPDDVQGGGSGAGTGGGVSNGAGQFGSMVKNFFNTHTGCKNFFTNNTPASWGTNGSLSFLTWMEHVGTYAQFVDITQRSNRSFAGETLGALGLVPSTDPEANFLLGQVINPPGIAGAITAPVSSSDEWLSYIGGNFHAESAIDQEVTITPEVLHMASQFDDPGVTSSLGLQVPQGVSPSSVISDWLKADCPDPKTYKYPTSGN